MIDETIGDVSILIFNASIGSLLNIVFFLSRNLYVYKLNR